MAISHETGGFPGGELPQSGKRDHPGVRQFANWLGMTCVLCSGGLALESGGEEARHLIQLLKSLPMN